MRKEAAHGKLANRESTIECATGLGEPLSLIEQGLIDTSCLISKRDAFNDILEAYRAFEAREDGCLKVVITPWEER